MSVLDTQLFTAAGYMSPLKLDLDPRLVCYIADSQDHQRTWLEEPYKAVFSIATIHRHATTKCMDTTLLVRLPNFKHICEFAKRIDATIVSVEEVLLTDYKTTRQNMIFESNPKRGMDSAVPMIKIKV